MAYSLALKLPDGTPMGPVFSPFLTVQGALPSRKRCAPSRFFWTASVFPATPPSSQPVDVFWLIAFLGADVFQLQLEMLWACEFEDGKMILAKAHLRRRRTERGTKSLDLRARVSAFL
ncbi:MAG: hypothetical protein HEP70_11905 [Rhodobiaceae bacterium]|nr:hypothetical protein [Rhodobiaceae bacterium]